MATGRVRIRANGTGIFQPGGIEKLKKNLFKQLRVNTIEVMKDTAIKTKEENGRLIQSSFKVKRAVFAKAFSSNVYSSKLNRLPSMELHNKIWWMNAHEKNHTITAGSGKKYMAIPITNISNKRIGLKKWKTLIASLIANKETFVKKKGSKLIMFAITNKRNKSTTSRFKQSFRSHSGQKKIKYGTPIPIAILQPQVRMKKRFDVIQNSKKFAIPYFKRGIEQKLSFTNLI